MVKNRKKLGLFAFLLIMVMLIGVVPVNAAGKAVKPSQPKISVKASDPKDGTVKVTVSIDKTKNAEGFEIYEKKSGDSGYSKVWTLEVSGDKKQEYSIEYSTKDKSVSIKVRAYNGSSYGKYSSVKKVTFKDMSSVKKSSGSTDTKSSSNANVMVYVTKTGSKYHAKKCGNGTFTETTLEEAEKRGLEPCSKCFK